ncbi:MAG: hypothetical protein HKN47_21870 [Pirellulaceae bacterium]|nr:hypothetical protein [Pirellulaceae bacterium]
MIAACVASVARGEELGEMWGTAEREADYYAIVDIPIPGGVPMRAGSFDVLPDGRLAVGTRRGDIYFVDGAFDPEPGPSYHLFATGQDEIFGLDNRDGDIFATQFGEVTKISDTNNDEVADRYETISNAWGYAEGHEFAFGSKFDREGNIWVALGLTGSYHSRQLFRGWCLKVTPDGKTIPVCSGLRSPAGVGQNSQGIMFCTESQGPWNGCCSLKHLKPGGFLGHPASYNWYPYAKGMTAPDVEPNTQSRFDVELKRVKQLVPPAVKFPYIKMGRSISGFTLNQTNGKFGPFENQIFVGDYTLSVVMRATTEEINGVWQGACYPFREGLATGIMNVQFSPQGQLIAGGFTTNSQWPVRGQEPFALQRIDWTGAMPFEIKEIKIQPDGFAIDFTKPVDRQLAAQASTYQLGTYTHIYAAFYGSPEVDPTTPTVRKAVVSDDATQVRIYLDKIVPSHIHDFDLNKMRSADGESLLHTSAYYTVNEIPLDD